MFCLLLFERLFYQEKTLVAQKLQIEITNYKIQKLHIVSKIYKLFGSRSYSGRSSP